MLVCSHACDQCLFSKERIVTKARAKEIITECLETNQFFECHKGNIVSMSICCRGFFEAYGDVVEGVKMAKRFKGIIEVDPDTVITNNLDKLNPEYLP